MARAEARLAAVFTLEHHPYRLNVAEVGSNLRIQIQTDPRYAAFVERAAPCEVLGIRLPVAALEDLLRGKVWAASERMIRKAPACAGFSPAVASSATGLTVPFSSLGPRLLLDTP